MRRLKPPMAYFGGKTAIAPDIAALLPRHRVYAECFGGSGAVLFAKKPSEVEVLSDLNDGLIHFYKIVQDPEQCAMLVRQLELTPYSRLEYTTARDTWEDEDDPVERARLWYIRQTQAYCGERAHASGWSFSTTYSSSGGAKMPVAWRSAIRRIPAVHARLCKVRLLCCDYRDVLARFDSPETVWYCDPPYLPKSETAGKTAGGYVIPMSTSDHIEMLDWLLALKGGVLLSGYHSGMYDSALRKWRRLDRAVTTTAARNKQLGMPPRAAEEGLRTLARLRVECLWLNPRLIEMWKG